MAKVNISIPDTLLYEIDSFAQRKKLSRSGLVQEAASRYVAELKEEEAVRQRQKRISAATAKIRRLSTRVGSFDGVAQIRRDRGRGSDRGRRRDRGRRSAK